MKNYQKSSRRTDDQLDAIMDETANWLVCGRGGMALCGAASLRQAIVRAEEYSMSGAMVVAITRQPSDNIIVFPEQIDRVRRMIVVRDMGHIEPA